MLCMYVCHWHLKLACWLLLFWLGKAKRKGRRSKQKVKETAATDPSVSGGTNCKPTQGLQYHWRRGWRNLTRKPDHIQIYDSNVHIRGRKRTRHKNSHIPRQISKPPHNEVRQHVWCCSCLMFLNLGSEKSRSWSCIFLLRWAWPSPEIALFVILFQEWFPISSQKG